jgi:hypothetical protein
MNDIVSKAVLSARESEVAFSKFITANDTGATGGHQSGFHIHKNSYALFFDEPGQKGANRDLFIKIKWQDDFYTDSRFIYYGTGTRNEYRLTRFGKNFPFLREDNIGDLLVIVRKSADNYEAFILNSDEDIENFFSEMGISATGTNALLPVGRSVGTEVSMESLFMQYIQSLAKDFPSSFELAEKARDFYRLISPSVNKNYEENPDKLIIDYIKTEFELFKAIENIRYKDRLLTPFSRTEELIEFSNTILNRRKSRAGKSLEHHLAALFTSHFLRFDSQVVTEENKRPDFIFPGAKEYHNILFESEKLVFLGAKTTCKDRWRQIINEADRINIKHLFTLQQGISSNQLREMKRERVKLVVPQSYISSFPPEFRSEIFSLHSFIGMVRTLQL